LIFFFFLFYLDVCIVFKKSKQHIIGSRMQVNHSRHHTGIVLVRFNNGIVQQKTNILNKGAEF
jgi:hypothetical protein